jgi:hypothetical protein
MAGLPSLALCWAISSREVGDLALEEADHQPFGIVVLTNRSAVPPAASPGTPARRSAPAAAPCRSLRAISHHLTFPTAHRSGTKTVFRPAPPTSYLRQGWLTAATTWAALGGRLVVTARVRFDLKQMTPLLVDRLAGFG